MSARRVFHRKEEAETAHDDDDDSDKQIIYSYLMTYWLFIFLQVGLPLMIVLLQNRGVGAGWCSNDPLCKLLPAELFM